MTGATGVLTNDADADSQPLTAVLEGGPANGTLSLDPTGGFSYTPFVRFAGTDAVTYRASDGSATSSPVTVTIVVTPTQCLPRPSVRIQPVAGGDQLYVVLAATANPNGQANVLSSLTFGELQNARVTFNGQLVASGQTVEVPGRAVNAIFTVQRLTPGQATTVPFVIRDSCGEWRTFVVGGSGAGFYRDSLLSDRSDCPSGNISDVRMPLSRRR